MHANVETPGKAVTGDVLISASAARARLGGISDMTLWRWQNDAALGFPKAAVIRGRKYFRESEISAFARSKAQGSKEVAE